MKKQTFINISITLIISFTLTYVIYYIKNDNTTKTSINNEETFISNKNIKCENAKKSLRFKEGLAVEVINNRFGYINESCNIIIDPQFGYARNFSDGFGAVQIKEYLSNNPEWKFINKQGKFLEINKDQTVDPNLGEIIIQDTKGFAFGLAAVKVRDKWGFINTEGNFVIYPRFHNATRFIKSDYNGDIFAIVELDGSWYGIKTDGTFRGRLLW